LKCHNVELASRAVVQEYAQDLRELLEESSIISQKAFLRSFVERIDVDDTNAKVIYTMPVPPDDAPTDMVGVLPIVPDGPPLGTVPEPLARAMMAKGALNSVLVILPSST